MSMRNEPDPLDALIDHAARQIVAGEPSSSLRSAVRDRIEHRRSAWSLSPAIAGAAVALVIAAVLVGRALLGPPDVGRTLSGPAGERNNVRPTIERVAIPAPPAPLVESDTRSVRLTRRLADDIAAPPQEEESLIPPIALEPLEPAQIAVGNPITAGSSGVMPIEVAPLQLEPLRGIE